MTLPTSYTQFKTDISKISQPEKFTFPFSYSPPELSLIAAKELQTHIISQKEWIHDFGNSDDHDNRSIGKMFGVLVVKNIHGDLGYLSAFSGKLADSNHHSAFVPPVYDMLKEGDFFIEGMKELNVIQQKIKILELEKDYLSSKEEASKIKVLAQERIDQQKTFIREEKSRRKLLRLDAKNTMDLEIYIRYEKELASESQAQRIQYKNILKNCQTKISMAENKLKEIESPLLTLKEERKNHSSKLQNEIFDSYRFLNFRKLYPG